MDAYDIVAIGQAEPDRSLAESFDPRGVDLVVTARQLPRLVDERDAAVVIPDQAVGFRYFLEDGRGVTLARPIQRTGLFLHRFADGHSEADVIEEAPEKILQRLRLELIGHLLVRERDARC